MKRVNAINNQRERRKNRTRTVIRGTAERPRLSVFRSNTRISAQLIDDTVGKTLVSVHDIKNVLKADALGVKIAESAKKAGVTKAVFDRGAYKYHGNVKAVAEGARKGGLDF
jgi:large subunit ribosomal protein L18